MKAITVFTPTYNRSRELGRLYNSLVNQTNQSYIWLMVDDGSTDNTEELVKTWKNEDLIQIQYFKQKNMGKSMAHNKGVELTKTELFSCVDSDDYLKENAIEEILKCWRHAMDDNVGILAFKGEERKTITTLSIRPIGKNGYVNSTLKNAYANLGLHGDTMLIFKTSVIQRYHFPCIEGEKFVPEAYLYDLIDQDGKLMILEKVLYICEYLEDGYTQNMAALLKRNPRGYEAYIRQRLKFDTKIKDRFLDTIRFVGIMLIDKENKRIIRDSVYPILTVLAYPFGVLFYRKRFKNIGENK